MVAFASRASTTRNASARALDTRALSPRTLPTRVPRLVRECQPAYGADVACGADAPAADAPAADVQGTVQPPRDAPTPADPEALAVPTAPTSPHALDALESLGDEIATLAAHIHAATHRLLTLLADFDARRGWERDGHRSCAHWLSFRTGIDLGAARENVRAARALAGLPETSAAMSRGELSFSQVRALTRVATPDDEGELLEVARGCSVAQLERVVRGWRRGTLRDEAERARVLHESRTLSLFHGDDGMVVVRGRLTPEVGALLMRAVEAASDVLYREESGIERLAGAGHDADGHPKADPRRDSDAYRRADPHSLPPADTHTAAARRRADALALLAGRAMAAGFGEDAPVSGTRAARYQVLLHVDEATLAEAEAGAPEVSSDGAHPDPAPHPAPRSHLDDGSRVYLASLDELAGANSAALRASPEGPLGSAETSRRLSCDAALVRVRHAKDGSILDVGRRTRTIPPALRRALEVRDRGCRFPGCESRFCDAHHVRHWGQGGETSLSNTVLLCRLFRIRNKLHYADSRIMPTRERK